MDTQTNKEQLAYTEYKNCETLMKRQATLFVELGENLKNIRDNKLYKYIGDGGFETWGRFLSQPEINLGFSTAYCYIRIVEVYIHLLQLDKQEVESRPFTKLQKLLPVLSKMTPEEAKTFYFVVIELGAKDFADEIKKLKGETKKQKPRAKECKTCGKWDLTIEHNEKCQCQKL